ncbi:MAG: tetratricopeptide repeat protein [Bacteroidota bacterium]|nr:tetratricopeptide repeat protein [Bacteroidota bacterium]
MKSFHPWQSVIQTNYDIIKAHSGEIKVETKEGEGSEFIVRYQFRHYNFYMKRIIGLLLLLVIGCNSYSQNNAIDSLKQKLIVNAAEDTNRVNLLLDLSRLYLNSNSEQAKNYSNKAKELSEKLGYHKGEAYALKNIGMAYYNETSYPDALLIWEQSLKLFENLHDREGAAIMLNNLGSIYMDHGDNEMALTYYLKSLDYAKQINNKTRIAMVLGNIGTAYSNSDSTSDKALDYYFKSLKLSEESDDKNTIGGILVNIGENYLKRNQDDSALYYFKMSLEPYKNTENIPYSLNDIGKTYTKKGNYDLAIQYQENALLIAKRLDLQLDILQSYNGLGNSYYEKRLYSLALNAFQKARLTTHDNNFNMELKNTSLGLAKAYAAVKDFSNAYKYQQLFTAITDTVYDLDAAIKISNLKFNQETIKKSMENNFNEQYRSLELKQQLEKSNLQYRNRLSIYGLIAGLFLLLTIAGGLWRRNIFRQKSFATLQKQKQETDFQKTKVEKAFEELKSTQLQLVQREKMASLGELTAGIAHEIQNPLNFVNNFSEVNKELVDELQSELKAGKIDDAIIISNDIRDNEEKINHHGKRADAIVKGMLQHSRSNNGQKEATDINALADEYLKLSYHAFRAKDKEFNAEIKADFDDSSGKINIVPQDIGRVVLNLINNAFYAVDEKKKQNGKSYEPTVSVGTKKVADKVEIKVADNGNGIPQNIIDKIFQPFFTTKPTGQGTGLGLSLSYDIIKAHGGDLKVESKEGEGSQFTIQLPTN